MKKRVSIVFALAGVLAQVCGLGAQAPPASADPWVMVESFYEIAPGKGDEWLEIYRCQDTPVPRSVSANDRSSRSLSTVLSSIKESLRETSRSS